MTQKTKKNPKKTKNFKKFLKISKIFKKFTKIFSNTNFRKKHSNQLCLSVYYCFLLMFRPLFQKLKNP